MPESSTAILLPIGALLVTGLFRRRRPKEA
ncbi:MAG: PEP-CTERM sorting domain-containing protein [Akkermansiaceae bacterium]|nr:PEP-CTERM sorting domain-containing protein [Armatimonadota bacterium]